MTVYVDDAAIPTTVGRWSSRWSHLTADTREELHEFAARLGLRRSYFQENNAKPGSFSREAWHYDLTVNKRAQAIRLGAKPVTSKEMRAVIMARAPLTRAARAKREAAEAAAGGAHAYVQAKAAERQAAGEAT
jgi:hypothetical protein